MSCRQSGNNSSSRRLVEDVVDHLHRVDQSRAEGIQSVPRLPTVHADADGADEALAFQIVDRPLPTLIVPPRVFPYVELLHVETVHAQVPQALFGHAANVIGRKNVLKRNASPRGPLAIFRRDLGGDVEPLVGMPMQKASPQPFAVSVAVGQSRIEEVAAQLDGQFERGATGHRPSRPSTDTPHAAADLANRPAHSSQSAIVHDLHLRSRKHRVLCYGKWMPRFFTKNAQSSAISSIRLPTGFPAAVAGAGGNADQHRVRRRPAHAAARRRT